MNEKFKKLAIKAHKRAEEFYNDDWKYNCAAWTGEMLETFAKSIVAECEKVAKQHVAETKPRLQPGDLKKHFGIE